MHNFHDHLIWIRILPSSIWNVRQRTKVWDKSSNSLIWKSESFSSALLWNCHSALFPFSKKSIQQKNLLKAESRRHLSFFPLYYKTLFYMIPNPGKCSACPAGRTAFCKITWFSKPSWLFNESFCTKKGHRFPYNSSFKAIFCKLISPPLFTKLFHKTFFIDGFPIGKS